MAQEKTLYRAAANGTGTTLDTGANSLVNKLNLDFKIPATVTACTITINSGPDGSTWTAVTSFNNVLEAEATVRLVATHRYYQAVITNYAGSGTIVVTCEPGEIKEIA
jgi:hypothetical protein